MRIESRARFRLAQLPTPIEELKSLSRELGGPELLIKRDDQTGLALGGNKTRKLEFLVGQALEQGADTLVTAGAAPTNHFCPPPAAPAQAGVRFRRCFKAAQTPWRTRHFSLVRCACTAPL